MKKYTICTLLFVTAQAFTVPFSCSVRGKVTVLRARPDTSKQVEAALEASHKYGPTSPEARIAWEAVEEMDASDNSASYEGGVSNEECMVEDSKACADYQDKLIELAAIIEAGVQPRGWLKKRIMEDREMNKERIKTLVEEIQAIRIASPDVKAGADSPAMREALKAAREATEEFGASSKEATLAWEAVEEIGAARNYENAMGASLEDECLIEKIEACEGIEEIKRVVNMDVYHD
mmetsp:Transcript_23715/g.43046  ORF Transcript_23715/g.43046 Transcript_23715/m.43046 type:complete len:235 (-) Transcript_23715:241-945(-)|eukprot:CAMPEP_0202502314 /NCGR_PEP_ID=MMETSP1361-20130828/38630_1 /ASSEMBLY_ACC=CAM_ASM_000849 /TAXON_ID=210615 /ORGANISM="Staurosira complex sp., Strain CCMP2646" /LENGTH=234 /DNA_ID=CAMNT_0049135303 /DNA_START=30 /DNA_END=734 /DNA_ORIENTATION=+